MIDAKTKEENSKLRKIIDDKLANDLPLTIEEQYFRCSNYTLRGCRDEPSCINEYYERVFMFRQDGTPSWLQVEGVDRNRFMALVREWQSVIETGGEHTEIIKASISETKEEIKHLRKQYPNPQSSKQKKEYDDKHFELLAWSKFRYILITKVFDLSIKTEFYPLCLDGKEIRFDAASYTHTLTRHFAHVMKQYQTEKDHFYDIFLHSDLHIRIKNLFEKIDKAKVLTGLPNEEVTFKYQNIHYRIFIQQKERFEKGKTGPQLFLRVTTFFPLTDPGELEELRQEYEERKVDSDIIVYVRKIKAVGFDNLLK